MALFRRIQEYIALDANNITLVFDSGNIVNISANIFLYPPLGHPILYNYFYLHFYLLKLHVLLLKIKVSILLEYLFSLMIKTMVLLVEKEPLRSTKYNLL